MADFLYLTLSDYVQHKHTPQEPEALEFYAGIDRQIGRLLELGAVLGATADHGMNGKTSPNGEPNVLYLGSLLREKFGTGIAVICPITDPYVLHHGALGGFVYVHLEDTSRAEEIARWILEIPGVTEVYSREPAAEKLELPADRIGDLVVMCASDYVLGRTPEDHDLSLLGDVLRSHGGRSEEMVPMLLSQMPSPEHVERSDTRSFDIFEFLCSGDAP